MKFVIQRVQHASVTVDNEVIGKIGKGFLVLIGVSEEACKKELPVVETGSFGADMKVELMNGGPFTIVLDSDELIK